MNNVPPDKFTIDVVRLMKILSDAQRIYIEKISNPADIPHNDATLVAMCALSVMCALQRRYSQKEIDDVYALAVKMAHQLYTMRQENVDTQVANMSPNGIYRN